MEKGRHLKLPSVSKEVSSRTYHILSGDSIESIEVPARSACVLIARSECLFFTVDLKEVPSAARRPYIEQQVRKHSPWPRPGHYVADPESAAPAVWIWDSEWLEKARGGLPAGAGKNRLLPETVMLAPGRDGPEACACLEGIDYQLWKGGRLVESRWCRQPFSEEAASAWQRGARTQGVPEVGQAAPRWQPEPWSEPALDWRQLLRDEKALMWGGALIATMVFCLELGVLAAFAIRTSYLEGNIADLEASLGEKLQYRLDAERLSAANRALAAQLPAYTQLEVVAEFTRLLADQPYELVEWEYQQGSLQVVVKNPELDSREVVSRLESGSFFLDARIEPGLRDGEHDISLVINQVRS